MPNPEPNTPAGTRPAAQRPSSGWGLSDITALVLAGGRGVRMGGVDKGLQPFLGQPLVQHALLRLAQQAGGAGETSAAGDAPRLAGVILNANRNPDAYRALGATAFRAGLVQVVPDRDNAFSGPLAGFQAGLDACASPLMLTVPCDSPLFPLDMAHRLLQALQRDEADMAVVLAPEACSDGSLALRSQPVFCLMRASVAQGLDAFLADGGRKVDAWTAGLRRVDVSFSGPGDDPRAFANANTLDELQQLES
jgi:molybdopterin-guanine dinucleotide biosynthesis protein A